MKQLNLFNLPQSDRADIPGDIDVERYGKGRKKLKPVYWDEDDPAYVTPGKVIHSDIAELTAEPTPRKPSEVHSDIAESTLKTPYTRVQAYTPKGTAKSDREYYRLAYKTNHWHYRHIRGGAIGSRQAEARKDAIEKAIAQGKPIKELLRMCK